MTDTKYLKTGVFTINKFPFIYGELLYNGINVSQDEREKEYYTNFINEHNLPLDYNFDEDPLDIVDQSELEMVREWDSCDEILIGYMRDEKDQIVSDPRADCQIILGESYGFVVNSRFYQTCNKCSPCFPYQCDIESEGMEEAYTLPKEYWDDDLPDWIEFKEVPDKHENLTAILLKGKI